MVDGHTLSSTLYSNTHIHIQTDEVYLQTHSTQLNIYTCKFFLGRLTVTSIVSFRLQLGQPWQQSILVMNILMSVLT